MVWPWEAEVSLELWGSRVEDTQSEHIPAGVLAPGVSAVRSGRKKQQHYSSQLALLPYCVWGGLTLSTSLAGQFSLAAIAHLIS